MARSKFSASVMAAVLAGLVLTGCGRGGTDSDKRNLDRFTAEEIYKRGEFELENSRKPEDAVFYFAEVERLYPYSEWAKRALIMQAYSNHRAQNYEEARGAAQRFIDTYPGDEDAAYAQYLLALSYYDQIDEVGRDQGLTFQALQSLRSVIEQYPDSEYARSAILGYNFQSSPFYGDAYGQLRGRGLAPEVRGDNWLTNVYRQMIQGRWL